MPEILELTSEQKRILLSILAERFPWLGTNEEASGTDAIDGLNELYQELSGEEISGDSEDEEL